MQSVSFLGSCRFAVLLSLLLLLGATARAQTVINSLPYTISAKGLYVLGGDLSSAQISGNLITISASNVTLDLQGHYLSGPAGNNSQGTIGIYAKNENNITVQNGTVSNCATGIYLTGSGAAGVNVNHRVDNLRVTHCYSEGIMLNAAPAGRVSNCQVSSIPGLSPFDGATLSAGINVSGDGLTVINNVVSDVSSFQSTEAYGIFTDGSTIIRANQIAGCHTGIYGGKIQDNLTVNCTTPFSNGTDAGGNN